jgi:aspartate kinase
MKFGGTSVTRQQSVAAINFLVKRDLALQPILVVSALSGTTDLLIKLTQVNDLTSQSELIELIKVKHWTWIEENCSADQSLMDQAYDLVTQHLLELSNLAKSSDRNSNYLNWHDRVASFGEVISSQLISLLLVQNGIKAQAVSATQCIITNDNFGSADFLDQLTIQATNTTLLPLINQGIVPVITGFLGATVDGRTTILGRGGSDFSAAIIGHALKAKEIQIWTDVNGVYSADPRVINQAKLIPQLSYQEAAELAMFGAKVLHPRTIQPAVRSGIPVRVLNTFNLDNQGTLIAHNTCTNSWVKAITWKPKVPLINIYSADMFLSKGFLEKIFAILAHNNISVNMLSASEVSVSITLDNIGNLEQALLELNQIATADYIEGFGTISLVGGHIMSRPQIMQDLFNLFEHNNLPVQMLSYSASNINISMIVASEGINQVIPLVHEKFIV